jgi:hypothetical protein
MSSVDKAKPFNVHVDDRTSGVVWPERVTSGCASSKGWHVRQETNLPRVPRLEGQRSLTTTPLRDLSMGCEPASTLLLHMFDQMTKQRHTAAMTDHMRMHGQ